MGYRSNRQIGDRSGYSTFMGSLIEDGLGWTFTIMPIAVTLTGARSLIAKAKTKVDSKVVMSSLIDDDD